jgi:hypothetical protein
MSVSRSTTTLNRVGFGAVAVAASAVLAFYLAKHRSLDKDEGVASPHPPLREKEREEEGEEGAKVDFPVMATLNRDARTLSRAEVDVMLLHQEQKMQRLLGTNRCVCVCVSCSQVIYIYICVCVHHDARAGAWMS